MTVSSPDVYVLKTDHATRDGVSSFVTLKFVYPGHVAYVHLDAEKAMELGIQLEFVAAEVSPEVVW